MKPIQKSLFPELKHLFVIPPEKPEPKPIKERMPIHIITWVCPDTGRHWERHFPQVQSMKDWKGERNLFRCLKNLEVMGTSYRTQTVDRTDYIWR